MKSNTSQKRDGEELTVASSVGDFVDVAGSAAIVDAASGRSGVRARMTVLRAFCIVHHKTTANDQQQPRQDPRGQKGCSRRAALCRGGAFRTQHSQEFTRQYVDLSVARDAKAGILESWHSRVGMYLLIRLIYTSGSLECFRGQLTHLERLLSVSLS